MGKVRRLRKKYHALCVKNKNSTENQNEGSKTKLSVANLDLGNNFSNLNTEETQNTDFDVKSTYSISKSIKSSLSGQSILKKDKQRLRHELFLKKLETSAEVFNKLRNNKKQKTKKFDLKDDLPQLCVNVNGCKNSNRYVLKNLSTKIKKNNSRKGFSKRKNAQLIHDIDLFGKILNDETIVENPHEKIQQHTLEKISKECLKF